MEVGSRVDKVVPFAGGRGKHRQPATCELSQKAGTPHLWITPRTTGPGHFGPCRSAGSAPECHDPRADVPMALGSQLDLRGSSVPARDPAQLMHDGPGSSAGLGLLRVDGDRDGVLSGTAPSSLDRDGMPIPEHL